MTFESKPSIINTQDARPFFGVGDYSDQPSDNEWLWIRKQFDAACQGILTHADGGRFTHRSKHFTEIGDEFISPTYGQGKIDVAIGELPTEGYAITVTYSTEAVDEDDGEPYDEWHYQSTYKTDQDGILIRVDRTPPSEDEDELRDRSFEEDMEAIHEFYDAQLDEIQQLGDRIQRELGAAASMQELDEVLKRAQQARGFLDRKLDNERTESDLTLNAKDPLEQESKELLKSLGMNEQPISKDEYNKLLELVREVFQVK